MLELGGIQIPTSPHIGPEMCKAIRAGHYELAERICVGPFLRGTQRVVELGGCLGFLACWLGRHGALVRSYEADPALAALAQQTVALNRLEGSVAVVPQAVLEGAVPYSVGSAQEAWGQRAQPERESRLTSQAFSEVMRWEPQILIIDIEGGALRLVAESIPTSVEVLVAEYHSPEELQGLHTWAGRHGLKYPIHHGSVFAWRRHMVGAG